MKEDNTFDEMVYSILEATKNNSRNYESFADEMKPFGFSTEDLQKATDCDESIEKEIQHQHRLNLVRAIFEEDADSDNGAA